MKILLTGATGFIGSRLRDALLAAGHTLVCVGRHSGPAHPRCHWVCADLAALNGRHWHELLAGMDAAANLLGLFRESRHASFEQWHTRVPVALFDACAAAGVQRVVQLSALGATADAPTAFLRSKHAADQHLLTLPVAGTVVQPSLVFGSGGASARRLLALAALPLLPLPAGGHQPVQPVHVDDVAAALQALLEGRAARPAHGRVALVGPRAMPLGEYLQALRQAMLLPRARTLAVPTPLVALAARVGGWLRGALLTSDAWRMLRQGSQADAGAAVQVLGHAPRPVQQFIAPHEAPLLRLRAECDTLRPLLQCVLALVWLWTAVVSLGLYPRELSLVLLAQAGVPQALHLPALLGAALLDALLGLLTLRPPARAHLRQWLWLVQGALITGYTAIITIRLPEYWLHPYGPISKNLPMLALLAALWLLDRPVRTSTTH